MLTASLPLRERGLKAQNPHTKLIQMVASLPLRERGLKGLHAQSQQKQYNVAPLAGAWIESPFKTIAKTSRIRVAPLAGAWIERINIFINPGRTTRRSPCGSVD